MWNLFITVCFGFFNLYLSLFVIILLLKIKYKKYILWGFNCLLMNFWKILQHIVELLPPNLSPADKTVDNSEQCSFARTSIYSRHYPTFHSSLNKIAAWQPWLHSPLILVFHLSKRLLCQARSQSWIYFTSVKGHLSWKVCSN